MHLKFALGAASIALHTTSAFLVPPQIHDAAVAAEARIEGLLSNIEFVEELDCPGCPYAGTKDGSDAWEYGIENKISLRFTVDNKQRLHINDVPVYPLDLAQPLNPLTLTAQQIKTSNGARSKAIPLGHAIEVYEEYSHEQDAGNALLTAKITILDLKGVPVKVDTVKATLLASKSEHGNDKLHIIRLDRIPFNETPGSASCDGQPIWSLCRLRAILASRLAQIVAAAKTHANAGNRWMSKPGKGCKGSHKPQNQHGGPPPKPNPHHHHGHPHSGWHRSMHRFGHMLHQAIRFFVVPVLLGVIGGLMASAVGMIVGQLIAYVWIRFRRNGQRGPLRRQQRQRHGEVVLVVEDEKDGLLLVETDQLPPPPAYQDAEVVYITDEKR